MRLGRIALLWAVAIALALLQRAEERVAGPAAPPQERVPLRPLVDLAEGDVAGIVVADGSLRVGLEQGPSGWLVTEPADAAVPPDLVRAFLDALFASVVLDTLPDDPGRTGPFGLDDARRIEVTARDGVRRVLVVGAETPTGTAVYVGGGDAAVWVIGRNVLVYRGLLLDAVRPTVEVEPRMDPVAGRALTEPTRPG